MGTVGPSDWAGSSKGQYSAPLPSWSWTAPGVGTPSSRRSAGCARSTRDRGLHPIRARHRARSRISTASTALVNGSRSVLRRRRTARDYVPPHQVNARSAESLVMLSAEHQAVVNALATLPPRQREVLVLRYYGGLSEAEIAEATGITRGTVKSTASRALDAVGRVMNPRARL